MGLGSGGRSIHNDLDFLYYLCKKASHFDKLADEVIQENSTPEKEGTGL
ncbi:hypothetical protein [Bacillus sp. JCM 19041]